MKDVLISKHGRDFGLADDHSVVAGKGLRTGAFPRQFLQPSPLHVVTFDEFDGAAILGTWAVLKGSDAGCVNFAINAALNGTIRGTTGATTTTMAGSGIQVDGHLNFEADSQGLEFGVRVKMSAVTNIAIFVGLTNQVAALQIPANGTGGGNGVTKNANDCVGFLYDTTMTTKDWYGVGVKGGVVGTVQDSGAAPVAATYDDMFVQVDATGAASFFLNGVAVGSLLANAVTKTVPLAPVIAAFSRTTASVNVDADYIYSACNRV